MRYLDPRADLTFKKVFGENPDLVKSLLNALLPFETPEEEIDEIEYLPAELVPDTPLKKNSIVDVRCRDMRGRRFIVEMQMLWSPAFMQRVLFNASKACVRQLGGSVRYELLQPVYSLNLLNGVFVPDLPDYYHDYRIVRMEHTEKVIEGLRFIFVELPKFTPSTFSHKKMHVLWLRYLTEINESTRRVSDDLLESPEIRKAVTQIEESAFSDAQDAMRKGLAEGREKGLAEGREKGLAEGREKGLVEGRAEGIAQGIETGRQEAVRQTARSMKADGLPVDAISRYTGLSPDEIAEL